MPEIRIVNEDKKIEKVIKSEELKTLLEELIDNNIYITSPCGGKGSCGKCLVKVNDESVYKLACQTPVKSDMTVQVVSSKPTEEKILVDGTMVELEVDPQIQKTVVKPEKLTYESKGLDKAIIRAFEGIHHEIHPTFSYKSYVQLSRIYKKKFEEVTLTVDSNELVLNIEEGDTKDELYGVALDLGTTTVAGYLWDLSKGERIATSSLMNKQSPYGADVLSRINYTMENENGIKELQAKAIETINQIIKALSEEGKIKKDNIYYLMLVGNTTMNHLLLSFDATNLGKSPYLPVTQKSVEARPDELSIEINPRGKITFMPNIAGFVGSDTIAASLAARLDKTKKELLIDLGTNGEIVVTGKGKMLAASTAAGPAFEGAKISYGMQASSGAISRAIYENNKLKYSTIGNMPPKGICGSGLMDVMAILIKEGVIDKTGRFVSPEKIDNLDLAKRINDKDKGFVIAFPDESQNGKGVYLTQKDIREVQLAKGAVAAGIKSLLKGAAVDYEELENVYLAGAFGNYVDVDSIKILGIIPDVKKEKIVPIGNAAGSGCQMALINKQINEKAKTLVNDIDHVELASRSDFKTIFMESMYF